MRPLGGHRRGAVLRPDELRGSGVSLGRRMPWRILPLLADGLGMTDAEIAERLDEPVAEVRQAARILYRMRKVDFILGYVVAVPSSAEGRRAA
jgi:hypothetical protein